MVGEYALLQEIGRGSFATVYKAKNKAGKMVAVKSVSKSKLNKKLAENLESEIGILQGIQHPHIVELYHVWVLQVDVENRIRDSFDYGVLYHG